MVVAAVYLVCLAILPLDGIWINDVGSRVILVNSIIGSGYSDFSIRWPGVAVDPTFDYPAIAYPFAVVRQGRLFSLFEPVLATVASPFYRLFGYPGLYVLPFAAAIAGLLGLGRLAHACGLSRGAATCAVLACALCTPIWFYSLTFWEHTLAIAFCVWGTLHFLRGMQRGSLGNLVLAAVLSAVATYFRPELYCFSFVMLVLILWRARGPRRASAAVFAATTVAALVPLWLFLWATVGAPFGLHLGTFVSTIPGLLKHILSRPMVFFHLFVLSSPDVTSSVVFSVPFLALFIVRPRLSPRAFTAAVPLLGFLALVIFVLIHRSFYGASGVQSPISFVGRTNSLFPTAPFLILGLVRCRASTAAGSQERSPVDLLWLVALVYSLVYWLAAPEVTKWGIHWGNRLMLILYPMLTVLVAANLGAWLPMIRGTRRVWAVLSYAAVALVILVSLSAQAWSISILQRKMDFSARFNREVGARPEHIVVTSLWWVGQELYDQFQVKQIFLVRTDEQRADLMRRLAVQGYSRYLAVMSAAEEIPASWGAWPEVVHVPDNGLKNWEVNLVSLEVMPARR